MSVAIKTTLVVLSLGLVGMADAQSPASIQDFYKVAFFSTKKAELTQQEFIDYSIETHVPLVLQIPGLRGYVLNFADPKAEDPAYNAVVELWFDSEEAFQQGLASSQGQAALEDQGNFLEGPAPYLAVQERMPIYPNRPAEGETYEGYKSTYLIPRNPEHSLEEVYLAQFRDYVPVAIGVLGDVIKGYEINFVREENPDFPIAMVINAWFTSVEDLMAAVQHPAMAKTEQIRKEYYGKRQYFDVIEYVAKTPPTLVEGTARSK